MDLKAVKALLQEENTSFKKQYGQNFLIDDNILRKIAADKYISNSDIVIEIGPGLGSLTDYLVEKAYHTIAYEIDQTMVNVLNRRFSDVSNLTIIKQDILQANIMDDLKDFDLSKHQVKVIANLPYYITTPILLKMLEELPDIYMIVMTQKEVAERICGKTKTKEYNALSVLIQYHHQATILFDVSKSCFYPEPDVNSSVVQITSVNPIVKAIDEKYFYAFNRNIFKNRRKTLVNNLKQSYGYPSDVINQILINNNHRLTIRSEELRVEEIVTLANAFYEWGKSHETH